MAKKKMLYVCLLSALMGFSPVFGVSQMSLEEVQKKAVQELNLQRVENGILQVENNLKDGIKKAKERAEKQQEEFDQYKMFFTPDKPTQYGAVIYYRDILPYQTEISLENLKLQKLQAQIQISMASTKLYKELLYLEELILFQEQNLKLEKEILKQNQTKYTEGLISKVQIENYQREFLAKEETFQKLHLQKQGLELELKNILNIPLEEQIKIESDFLTAKTLKLPDEYIKSALGNRVDLKIKENEWKSLEKEYTLYKEYNPPKSQYELDKEREDAEKLLEQKEIVYHFMIEKDVKESREAQVDQRASKESKESKERSLEVNYYNKKAEVEAYKDSVRKDILAGYQVASSLNVEIANQEQRIELEKEKMKQNKILKEQGVMTELQYQQAGLLQASMELELRKLEREYHFSVYQLERAALKGPGIQNNGGI